MAKHNEALIQSVLLVVATCVLFVPEWRTASMRLVLFTLLFMDGAIIFYRLRASGVLGLTPKGILHARSRPHFSLLSHAAILMSIPAVIVLSLS